MFAVTFWIQTLHMELLVSSHQQTNTTAPRHHALEPINFTLQTTGEELTTAEQSELIYTHDIHFLFFLLPSFNSPTQDRRVRERNKRV